MTSEISHIRDFSYILDADEKIVGVSDDVDNVSIERVGRNTLVITGDTIPEDCFNRLAVAWLLLSNPDIIKPEGHMADRTSF